MNRVFLTICAIVVGVACTPTTSSFPAEQIDSGTADASEDGVDADLTDAHVRRLDAHLSAGLDGHVADADLGALACADRCMPQEVCVDDACVARVVVTEAWATFGSGQILAGADVLVNGERPRLYATGERMSEVGLRLPSERGRAVFEARAVADSAPEFVELRTAPDDGDHLLRRIPVVDLPVRGAGAPCTKHRAIDVCEPGTLCIVQDHEGCAMFACAGAVGRCEPVAVEAVVGADEIIFDINGGSVDPQDPFFVNGRSTFLIGDPEGERRPTYRVSSFSSPLPSVPLSLTNGVYEVVMTRLPWDRYRIRSEGEECDVREIFDRCDADLVCADGRCEAAIAPTLDQAVIAHTGDAIGFWATGTDPNHDLAMFALGGLRELGWFRSNTLYGQAQSVRYDNDRFEAYWSGPTNIGAPDAYELRLEDSRELEVRRDVAIQHVPIHPPGELGARCDFTGVVHPCRADLVCGQRRGVDPHPVCQAPTAECPDAVPELVVGEAQVIEAGPQRPPDERARLSCNRMLDRPVYSFRFQAPGDGRYQFAVSSPLPVSVALRAACALRHSEVGCVSAGRAVDDVYYAELRHGMVGGQVVTLAAQGVPRLRVLVTAD